MNSMTNEKMNETINFIDIRKIIGVDYDPADTEVGIREGNFNVAVEDVDGNQVTLFFGDSEIVDLLSAIKPYVDLGSVLL